MTMHSDKLRNILQLPGEYDFSHVLVPIRENLLQRQGLWIKPCWRCDERGAMGHCHRTANTMAQIDARSGPEVKRLLRKFFLQVLWQNRLVDWPCQIDGGFEKKNPRIPSAASQQIALSGHFSENVAISGQNFRV
jgi:hypothetical protein